jgi:pSer/pThr/pTyr-binding forkhead associated (FHA) protein
MRSWVIGSGTVCDVVVDSPLASSRHCELTQAAEWLWLKDLGSTNGTYVNGQRIAAPIRLTAGDSITLGRTVSFPWPPELTTSIWIGRLSDNDIVLDDPRVSGHHARLVVVVGFQTLIEDLGSSNGTFLNSPDRRVIAPTPITESDTLYFGTLAVPAARLLESPTKPDLTAAAQNPPVAVMAPGPLRTPAFTDWKRFRWLLTWLVQAPILAMLIVVIFGRPAAPDDRHSLGQGIAATTFALAIASIWLGCTLAVAEFAAGRLPVHPPGADWASFSVLFGTRLAVFVSLCSLACAVMLAVVYWGAGLKGPWPAMWGVLAMTSIVSLLLGLTVSVSVRHWAAAAAVLLICFAAMIAAGGRIQPLPKMSPPVQLAAGIMPSRWAFEGLCLLETPEHRAPAKSDETDATQNHDLVEVFFPAASDRMGVTADAMALGFMLVGLTALAMSISGPPRIAR